MKKTLIVILAVFAAIIIFFALIISMNNLENLIGYENLIICRSSDDCVIVHEKSCCGGDRVINQKYEFYWNLKPAIPCVGRVFCKTSIKLDYSACIDNKCRGIPAYQLQRPVCSSDDDCILVKGRGCCGCETAINKNDEEFWNSMLVEECPGRGCEMCPTWNFAKCIESSCKGIHQLS